MFKTEASRERWTLASALVAVLISIGALVVAYLQLRSADRTVAVAERARQDAVSEAERQRSDARATLDQQRKDSAAELEEQTKRADRANALADRSAKAAEMTAKVAAEQLELADRAWIKIIGVETRGNNPIVPALSFQHPPTWPNDRQQVTFQIDVSYRNTGRSVARVTADFWLFLELWKNGYDDAIRKDGKDFCDSHNVVRTDLSVIAYPGDESLHWAGAGANLITPENTNYLDDRKPGVGFIVPSIAVCINYQFGGSPKVYQTRAFYEIFRKDDRTRFFEVGVPRPEKDIFLIRYPYLDAAF